MAKPNLSLVDSSDHTPEPTYECTLLQSQQPNHYYAKLLDQVSLKLPYWNKFKRVQYSEFEKFCEALDTLLYKPLITQVLGVPASTLAPSDKVRRTAQNFSFTIPGYTNEAPILVKYNYIILDLDREPEVQHPKIKARLNDFVQAYEEYDLNENILHKTLRAILAHVLGQVYRGPFYFRASASFGKPETPYPRGHIYIPLTEYLSIDELAAFTYASEAVDHTPYFNPTQPIFTAAPIRFSASNLRATAIHSRDQTTTEESGTPLEHFENLKRSYYWKGDEHPLDAKIIREKYSEQILTRKEFSPNSKLLPATELSGKRGAFNRVARSHDKFSIDRWLTTHGYIHVDHGTGTTRYLSPYSKTGNPGVVVFSDGYIIDFHEQSPLKDILAQQPALKDKKIFTAYDLWYLEGLQLENPAMFRRMVDQAIALDPMYQKVWHEKLDLMTTFISPSLTPQEIDEVIRGILEEVFFAGLKEDKRHRIFEAITDKVADLKIKDFRRPLSKLQKLFQQIAKDFAAEHSTVHPSNTDTQNAKSFVEATQIFQLPDQSYVAESLRGDMLKLLTTDDELEQYVQAQIPRKSNAPLDWQHGKIVSSAKVVVKEVKARAQTGDQSPLRVSEELYMFKGSDKRRAINFKTGEMHSPLLNEFVIKELPFTEEQYKKQQDLIFSKTHWGQFLLSSFEGHEENIEHIRDAMSFIMMPERPGQQLFMLLGITRSGKTTIKNVMGKLLGRKFTMEKMFKDLKDQFALAELTPLTRMFVINEFNIGSLSRAATQDAINFLKALSGDDSIAVRRMRTDPIEVHPVAVPVLVSNETPHIDDPAFIARLRVIKFRRSFIHKVKDTIEFQQNLINELPYIFEWVRTNPRYRDGKINFEDSKTSHQDLLEVSEEADPVGTFCKTYLREMPGAKITRTEFTTAFRCYYEMTMGELPPENFETILLRQPALRVHLPTLAHRRERKWVRKEDLKVMLPEARAKLGDGPVKDSFLVGIYWIDYEWMKEQFSPFNDVIPPTESEEDLDDI